MRFHPDGYAHFDGEGDNGWARVFCAAVADGSCGLLLVQHHSEHVNEYFDYKTEANLALVTGADRKQAIQRFNKGDVEAPHNPAAFRRLSRLLIQGGLYDSILDTLAERGLLRAVAYAEKEPEDKRLSLFDRAGFTIETRHDKRVRILELD